MGMIAFALAILWKAVATQIISGPALILQSAKEHTRIETLEPERGNIFSEDGSMLSISIPEFEIRIDFGSIQKDTFNKNVIALSKQMANLFKDKTTGEYETELSTQFKAANRYYLLKSHVPYDDYIKMRSFVIFKKGANKGGFMPDETIKRVNPFGLLANRTIGLHKDNGQNVGLEGKFEEDLGGEKGHRIERKIAGGTWMPIDGGELESKNGRDIVTTIDVNTQDIAENALLKVLIKEEATFGTCIVMETNTGKIKAMANLGRQADGSYFEDLNYALRPIEPGSTFKINALMSAIDDGYVNINNMINCYGGVCKFGDNFMHDSHPGTWTVSLKDVFAHSSNVGTARIICDNYATHPMDYIKHLQKMQIDKTTGIDLLGELKPTLRIQPESYKRTFTLASMAIGYSVQISPLRTCMVYNTIANNGKIMKPYIVKEVREFGKIIKKFEPTVLDSNVCKQTTIDQLKEAAFEVIQSGTGKALKNNVYTICGKTGTAKVADKGIKYTDGVFHGSFVGFFPKENPRYTICVVVRTKKGANTYYGGAIALPVFKEVADKLYANEIKIHHAVQNFDTLRFKNCTIKNTTSDVLTKVNCATNFYKNNLHTNDKLNNILIDSLGNASYTKDTIALGLMPSTINMGLKDAVYLLEKKGMHVIVSGKGKVIAQSVLPGDTYYKGQFVKLDLN
jgi:cell division protein FtsI (penicillin-binding protein 3)